MVGVILNTAIWFAVHTIFAKVRPFRWEPVSFDAPLLASVRMWALVLAVAPVVAMFRFKVGMIPTLIPCSARALGSTSPVP